MSKWFFQTATSANQFSSAAEDFSEAGKSVIELAGHSKDLGTDVAVAGGKVGTGLALSFTVPVLCSVGQAGATILGATGLSSAMGSIVTFAAFNPLVLPGAALIGGLAYAGPQIIDAGKQVYNIGADLCSGSKNLLTGVSKGGIGILVKAQEKLAGDQQYNPEKETFTWDLDANGEVTLDNRESITWDEDSSLNAMLNTFDPDYQNDWHNLLVGDTIYITG